MARRTLIVGDVHGCLDELKDLMRACRYDAEQDEVFFVGDLVAKGPMSVELVHWARQHGARAVRGNHEDVVLDVLDGRHVGTRPAHARVAASLDNDDVAWLRALPLWLDLPEHGVRIVHAGLQPGLPMEAQDPRLLMTMRTIDADGVPSSRSDAGPLWACRWAGPPFVVFGHAASAGLQQHPAALGLDTGCVYGRHLTAYLLPERRIVSVRAREAYAVAGGPARTYAGPCAALQRTPRVVPLGPDTDGSPREALVLSDQDGQARAYLNRCKHLPVPIDAGGRRFLTPDGEHLLCGTHGAEYRLRDGVCVAGPCEGATLQALRVEQSQGLLWVVDA